VLKALGLDESRIRSSLRFGLGRFNTAEEVEEVINILSNTVTRLRRMSS
jgi:cysteine desulfurase